ncbi:hypothetical protein JCM8115_002304, partial [Rhodotorula mucilaginosa]
LLRHLGLDFHANAIAKATYDVLSEGKVRTPDMGGNNKTTDFTRAIIQKL